MKNIIIASLLAFILGICMTITITSVQKVIALSNQTTANTKAIGEIVQFINNSVEASKKK